MESVALDSPHGVDCLDGSISRGDLLRCITKCIAARSNLNRIPSFRSNMLCRISEAERYVRNKDIARNLSLNLQYNAVILP